MYISINAYDLVSLNMVSKIQQLAYDYEMNHEVFINNSVKKINVRIDIDIDSHHDIENMVETLFYHLTDCFNSDYEVTILLDDIAGINRIHTSDKRGLLGVYKMFSFLLMIDPHNNLDNLLRKSYNE